MKVMAFNARPDERAFFDHFSQSLDMDLTLQKDTLTLDNVALTRGYDGMHLRPACADSGKAGRERCPLCGPAHHRLR